MTNQKEGTLVLLHIEKATLKEGELYQKSYGGHIFKYTQGCTHSGDSIQPIIVCDDEIKEQDVVVFKNSIVRVDEFTHDDTVAIFNLDGSENKYNEPHEKVFLELAKKVLINTSEIPDNIIQAIASGELKDGDKVLVEFDNKYNKAILPIGLMGKNSKCIVIIPKKDWGQKAHEEAIKGHYVLQNIDEKLTKKMLPKTKSKKVSHLYTEEDMKLCWYIGFSKGYNFKANEKDDLNTDFEKKCIKEFNKFVKGTK